MAKDDSRILVNKAVRILYEVIDSALCQAREGSQVLDELARGDAEQTARQMYAALLKARLFILRKEEAQSLMARAVNFISKEVVGPLPKVEDPIMNVFATKLIGMRRMREFLEEEGLTWPPPEQIPFESCFFCYVDMNINKDMMHTRVRYETIKEIGVDSINILGHLIVQTGDTVDIYEAIRISTEDGQNMVGLARTYDGEWSRPQTMDPWFIESMIRSINAHKSIIEEQHAGLSIRMERKNQSKRLKVQLPIPAPFYLINLKDELIEPPILRRNKPTGKNQIEWSHRWDVRGHEVTRVMRGELPLDAKTRANLMKREYKIYDQGFLSADDANRLLKRHIRGPAANEWIAVLTYWREAFVKGPPDAPYVPGARVLPL